MKRKGAKNAVGLIKRMTAVRLLNGMKIHQRKVRKKRNTKKIIRVRIGMTNKRKIKRALEW